MLSHISKAKMLGLCVLVSCYPLSADERQQDQARRYEDGPLKIKEFRGKPDDRSGGDAFTYCTVHFEFTYEVRPSRGMFTATLTSFKAFALFFPDKSWWIERAPRDLLDHEQGHFDIAEATARRLEYTFAKAFSEKRRIQARGTSQDTAITALRSKLNQVVNVANEQATQDNLNYDAMTLHGTRLSRQAEHRRIQKATLVRLAKKISQLTVEK